LNFSWNPTTQNSSTRAYQYYGSAGAQQDFVWPMVFLCDGSEPSLDDLLGMAAISGRNKITPANVSSYLASSVIDDLYIGNKIMSRDFDGVVDASGNITANGTRGWAVGKGGKAVLQNAVVRGAVYATSGSFSGEVFASSGTFNGTVNATGGTFSGTVAAGAVDIGQLSGTTTIYATPGTYTITIGANMNKLRATLIGGGGDGAAQPDGGGGGGGGLSIISAAVTPGQQFTLTVGDRTQQTILTGIGFAGPGGNGVGQFPGAGGAGTTNGSAGGNGSSYQDEAEAWHYYPGYGGASGGNYGPMSGVAGNLYGGGGGGGGGYLGARGKAIIEISNTNGVVLYDQWKTLTDALTRQGIQIV
jgi:hypothetical protein